MYPTPPPSPRPVNSSCPESRLGFILASTYRLTEVLGVGAYGTVYRAVDVHTQIEYAVKALNKAGLDPRQRKFQEREIRLHHLASQHDNVVSLVKILDSPECTYVVIEFCSEGDLFSKITEHGDYVGNDYRARFVFQQILAAVQHCHSRGIYHRDLKPENILVSNSGWTVKLADFGLATQEDYTSDFGCGSTFYMSPECQQTSPKPFAWYASAPNDVWALGVILVNLTCGRNPWKRACLSDPTYKAYIRDRNFLKSILPISDDLNAVLQRIFEPDARSRITLSELQYLIDRCCTNFTSPAPPATGIITPPESPECQSQACDTVMDQSVDAIPQLEQLPSPRFSPATTRPQQISPPSAGLCTPPSYTNAPRSTQATNSFYPFGVPSSMLNVYSQMVTTLGNMSHVPNHMFPVRT